MPKKRLCTWCRSRMTETPWVAKFLAKSFFTTLTNQPTIQPTLWFCGEPPSTPGHTSPQQAPDPTTWRLAGPGNKFWMNNVDLCDLWHFLWLAWLVTMLSPQELRSRAKESSSSWGQYLRIMLDLKLKGLSYIYDQTYIHTFDCNCTHSLTPIPWMTI